MYSKVSRPISKAFKAAEWGQMMEVLCSNISVHSQFADVFKPVLDNDSIISHDHFLIEGTDREQQCSALSFFRLRLNASYQIQCHLATQALLALINNTLLNRTPPYNLLLDGRCA